MPGYFGSETQRRLQMQAEANVDFIGRTPGVCQTGRTMGCDDPDALGWDRIREIVRRDGICGFRLLSADKAEEVRIRFAGQAFRFDRWDVFVAKGAESRPAAEAILARGLPAGLRELARPVDPEGDYMRNIQALMAGAGIVPFSGSLLAGALGPATTAVIGDETGNVVAAAHCYLPHNSYSPYRRYAWGGLVAVEKSQRGKGLGNYVNARMAVSAFDELEATHLYELVSADNQPSRRMVAACGLAFDPSLICGVLAQKEGARFTR